MFCLCSLMITLFVSNSLQDYTEVLTFPATSRANVRIKSMAYGRPEAQLYIVLDNGHFIICTVNIPVFEMEPNYSPVKTECPGNGKLIHCINVLMRTLRSVLTARNTKYRATTINFTHLICHCHCYSLLVIS